MAPASRAMPPGRGLSVLLCEKDDLARRHVSSRSGKLVHGGLRYLEYYEFRLVREALIEREVLLAAAPHIIWPMRFVLPHSPDQRPAWLVRLGLFLYDHLGGRKRLPPTPHASICRPRPKAQPLRPEFQRARSNIPIAGSTMRASSCSMRSMPRSAAPDPDAHRRDARPQTGRGDYGRSRCKARMARRMLLGPRAGQCGRTMGRGRDAGRVSGVNSPRQRAARQGQPYRRAEILGRLRTPIFLQNTDKRVIFVNPYQDDLA